ncbi:MAG: shikimate kinase [Chloroflexi bacterium]|nr:shikimate kinase [Chloroflexota bacterium]
MKRSIFLTGFSGAGKTSVGRELARLLGWNFFDLDREVVESEGRPIHEIQRKDGVPYYRCLEGRCLLTICESEPQVVATGSGTILDDDNWRIMDANGIVVCLEAKPETILDRLIKKYPDGVWIAQGDDPVGQIRARQAERQPRYALARITMSTDSLTPGEVAAAVIERLKTIGYAL